MGLSVRKLTKPAEIPSAAQDLRGPDALAEEGAVGQQAYVFPVAQDLGAAGLKIRVLDGGGQMIVTDVVGRRIAQDGWETDQHILEIRGTPHVHAGDAAHQSDVLERLMRGPVGLRDEARETADELHRKPRDPHIRADKLERPHGEKARERMDHRDAAAQGETGRGADQGLLADADIDEARTDARRQPADRRPVLGGHDDDALIGLRQGIEQILVGPGFGMTGLSGPACSHQ